MHGHRADPAAQRQRSSSGRAPRRSSPGPRSGRSAPALLVEVLGHVLHQPVGAGGRVDHHRQVRPVAPAPQRVGGAPAISSLPCAIPLGAPWRGAAVPADVGRDPQRPPGAGRHGHERLRERRVAPARRAARRRSGSRTRAGRRRPRRARGRRQARRRGRGASPPARSARAPRSRGGARARPRRAPRGRRRRRRGAAGAQPGPRGALGRPKCRATARAARSSRSVRSRARKRFMSRPVSIATGQDVMQVPSAAHVCTAS